MIQRSRLPPDIALRLQRLPDVLGGVSAIRFAYLFGGAARDELRPLSDIDLAVYVDASTDLAAARLEIIGLVTRALGTDEVDVVVLNTAPTALAGTILASRRVILDRDPFARHQFESLVLRQYFDVHEIERRFFARRFARG